MRSDVIVTTLVVLVLPIVNLYPLLYAFRPWRSTHQGRALMVKALGNMIVIDMAAATLVLGYDYPGRDLVRVVGFALFAAGMYYLAWSMLTAPNHEEYPPYTWWRRLRRGRSRVR